MRLLRFALLALILLAAPHADAFCGFYVGGAGAKLFNDATMVVLVRDGTRTVLSMQNAYKGPPEKFAMVVPVPVVLQEENVKTLKPEMFDHIDQLASPRLVEYWEQDPCGGPSDFDMLRKGGMPAPMAARSESAAAPGALGVTIEAQFAVGEYQIVILSAKDAGGLDTWLRQEKYTIPEGAEPYFRPYIAAGSKFFVARVDTAKVKMQNGMALLSPLRFHYDTDEFKLPVRLGLINSSGTQDLIVHILAKSRYEVANYPNVTIPTNFDVTEAAQDKFATFYTTLFDRTVEKNPKAVVTEYAWAPTTCDPCPGPALDMSELASFGYDVLPSLQQPPPAKGAAPGRAPMSSMFYSAGSSFVLTRLHARYTRESLGEDLVFKAVDPIVGGREMRSADGTLEHGATKTSFNNFQARYAIRHEWKGPITCKDPKRGVWGGPPSEHKGGSSPKAASRLGLAEHVKADLKTFVAQDIPELEFKAKKKGCLGCAITDRTEPATAGWLAAFGALVFAVRSRQSRQSRLRHTEASQGCSSRGRPSGR